MLNPNRMHHIFGIFEENDPEIRFTEDMEIHIIEMPKFKPQDGENDEISSWINLFKNKKEGHIMKTLVAPNSAMIDRALDEFDTFTADEQLRDEVEAHQKWVRYNKTLMYEAKRDGRIEGIKEGLWEGIKQGRKDQARKQAIITAKRLLKLGMPVEQISAVTGLSIRHITHIKGTD